MRLCPAADPTKACGASHRGWPGSTGTPKVHTSSGQQDTRTSCSCDSHTSRAKSFRIYRCWWGAGPHACKLVGHAGGKTPKSVAGKVCRVFILCLKPQYDGSIFVPGKSYFTFHGRTSITAGLRHVWEDLSLWIPGSDGCSEQHTIWMRIVQSPELCASTDWLLSSRCLTYALPYRCRHAFHHQNGGVYAASSTMHQGQNTVVKDAQSWVPFRCKMRSKRILLWFSIDLLSRYRRGAYHAGPQMQPATGTHPCTCPHKASISA